MASDPADPLFHLQPDYTEDGIDLARIRWSLLLTPAERLEQNERPGDHGLMYSDEDEQRVLRILRLTLEEKRKQQRRVC